MSVESVMTQNDYTMIAEYFYEDGRVRIKWISLCVLMHYHIHQVFSNIHAPHCAESHGSN